MEGLLLLIVPVVALVAAGVGLLMVLDVTMLGGDRVVEARSRRAEVCRPPFVSGAELLAWARETGARLYVSQRGPGRRSRKRAAAWLHEGSTDAMVPWASARDLRRHVPCPEGGLGTIGVNAAEVLGIADYIRRELPRHRQVSILERAVEAAEIASESEGPFHRGAHRASACSCALQGDDGVCLAYASRPLRCRPHHVSGMLDGSRRTRGDDGRAKEAHARVVAEGIEQGWLRAMQEAGLDGSVYELNSALAVALRAPDAETRWRDGDDVFALCEPAPPTSMRS